MFKYTFENSNSDKNSNEKQVIKDHKISVQKSSGEEYLKIHLRIQIVINPIVMNK